MPKFGSKKCLIWVFLSDNALFVDFLAENLSRKLKCLNVGPEMPDLRIFNLKLENNIVIFEISTLEFV